MKERFVVGIDEVGRGPIAGPVCVGLVVIERRSEKLLEGIKDSKKLSEKRREEWFRKIKEFKKEGKLDFTCAMVGASVIDKKGIVFAINQAITKVLHKIERGSTSFNFVQGSTLHNSEMKILLDGGLKAPEEFKNQKTIIKGDEKVLVIAAASVVAKVSRDRLMVRLAQKYPRHGFERHKGYGTAEHYKSLKKFGLSTIHRISFLRG